MLDFFFTYLLGLITGFGIFSYMSWCQYKKQRAKIREALDKVIAATKVEEDKLEVIKPRLQKAAEIANQQMELLAQVDQPNKGALHSRHKNDVIAEIKLLEEEKRDLLRSILKDGYDPQITISNEEGQKEVVTLSQYMLRNGIDVETAEVTPPINTDDLEKEGKITRVGKFFIVPGGKNDTTH